MSCGLLVVRAIRIRRTDEQTDGQTHGRRDGKTDRRTNIQTHTQIYTNTQREIRRMDDRPTISCEQLHSPALGLI